MHLPSLTDQELVSYFRFTRNDFTTTALEAELAERLAAALDGAETVDGLEKQIEQLEEDKEDLEEKLGELDDVIFDLNNDVGRLKADVDRLETELTTNR